MGANKHCWRREGNGAFPCGWWEKDGIATRGGSGAVLQKWNTEWPHAPALAPSARLLPISRELKADVHTKMHMWMFIAALFVIGRKWKLPKCPSTEGWINEMCYSHEIEYYSPIKRNKILIHATTWMNFENIMLSERHQSLTATYDVIPFTWNVWILQRHVDR